MVTIKQIAEMAGVSRGTVDRVVNHRGGVNLETEQKIRGIIEMVGYTPNVIGQTLASRQKSIRLGFLVAQGRSDNPFFTELMEGARAQARQLQEYGVEVDWRNCDPEEISGGEQVQVIEEMLKNGIQGLAVTPLNHDVVAKCLAKVTQQGVPVVTVNSDLEESGRLCYVGSDYSRAGETAGGLMDLFHLGSGTVGIITGFDSIFCHTEREKGFRQRLSKHRPDICLLETVNNQDDDFVSFDQTRTLLRAHPEMTGLYVTAAGVYGACRAVQDMGCAERLRVVCHDLVPNHLKMLEEGVLSAVIDQEPARQGALPLQILYDYLVRGIAPERERMLMQMDINIWENSRAGARKD